MHIPIANLCGPYCVNPFEGARVYAEAVAALQRGEPVCLDFTGVKVLLSEFATAAVGRLFGAFTAAELKNRLSLEGLDAVDHELLQEVMVKAQRYYDAPPQVRDRLVQAEKQFALDD